MDAELFMEIIKLQTDIFRWFVQLSPAIDFYLRRDNLQSVSVVARSWKHQRNGQNGCKQWCHGENDKLYKVLDPIGHGEKHDSHEGESE